MKTNKILPVNISNVYNLNQKSIQFAKYYYCISIFNYSKL